jgi:hypothetical protein
MIVSLENIVPYALSITGSVAFLGRRRNLALR